MNATNRTIAREITAACQGWQWCNWCEGQTGGCEFCDGTGKRACPCHGGDIDGKRWDHGPASDGRECGSGYNGGCGYAIDAGQPTFRSVDDPETLAHVECVIPAYGAADQPG